MIYHAQTLYPISYLHSRQFLHNKTRHLRIQPCPGSPQRMEATHTVYYQKATPDERNSLRSHQRRRFFEDGQRQQPLPFALT